MNTLETNHLEVKIRQYVSIDDTVLLKDEKQGVVKRLFETGKILVDIPGEPGRLITEEDIVRIIVRVVKKTGILAKIVNFLNRYA